MLQITTIHKSTLLLISHITIGKYAFGTNSHIGTALLLDRFANKKIVKQHHIFLHIKQKTGRDVCHPGLLLFFFQPCCLQYWLVTPTSDNQHGENPALVNNLVQKY